jgi:hypothetical protein
VKYRGGRLRVDEHRPAPIDERIKLEYVRESVISNGSPVNVEQVYHAQRDE